MTTTAARLMARRLRESEDLGSEMVVAEAEVVADVLRDLELASASPKNLSVLSQSILGTFLGILCVGAVVVLAAIVGSFPVP